ncbi:hypothetical protein L6R52_30330 [Myxococcota bacterium]|nr:hypothetical protein [Myxococcota bacterium]
MTVALTSAALALLPGCTRDVPTLAIATQLADRITQRSVDLPTPEALDALPYSAATFAATHNSYAGALGGGDVAGLGAQLDRGVRALELDVHDDGFREHGFRVGHLLPGSEVFHGDGNPESDALADWLALIARWSERTPGHAPITLTLDLKDDLDENPSAADGDLGALNALLARAFGEKLFRADTLDAAPWPSVRALRGRVVVVLSGSESARIAYRGDRGASPAVAMNAKGHVVEVHDDGRGNLSAWTGVYHADGRVEWVRHARYDTGVRPAIALRDDGLVVEVHEDPDHNDDQLWYRVGRLGDDLAIDWFHERGLALPDDDEGLRPTLRFAADGTIHEIHESPTTGHRWSWSGTFDAGTRRITWSRDGTGRTRAPRFAKGRATAELTGHGRASIEVFAGNDGAFGPNTLLYTTDRVGPTRVRLEQLAFVELQPDSSTQLESDGLVFYAGPAASLSARLWVEGWRAAGKVARLWCFNDATLAEGARVNFPATDRPFDAWYDGYRHDVAAVH